MPEPVRRLRDDLVPVVSHTENGVAHWFCQECYAFMHEQIIPIEGLSGLRACKTCKTSYLVGHDGDVRKLALTAAAEEALEARDA